MENPHAYMVRSIENRDALQGLTVESRDPVRGRKVGNHLFPQGKFLWSWNTKQYERQWDSIHDWVPHFLEITDSLTPQINFEFENVFRYRIKTTAVLLFDI
jgi:hypothetical protein